MERIARLLRPAPRRNLSTLLAAALPALALAGTCLAGLAHADVIVEKPDRQATANFNTCAKPLWPQAALAAQQTGTVTLTFLIDADGKVGDSRVDRSSGHPALDEAAREGIAKCRFVPGQVQGKPVQSWMKMQYVWTLE